MNTRDLIRSGCSGLMTAVLLACGGGGGTNVAGIGGTGITSSGTITGFGSIFVNGVEFETGTAVITVDGSPGSESDLGLGMVVNVTGTVNEDGITGTADSVVFDDEVQGPIENDPEDPTGDGNLLQFSVMDTVIEADRTATVFDGGAGFAGLAQGDFIEVSGFFDQDGVLHATRIDGKGGYQEGISEVEVKGTAQNIDAGAMTFELGPYTVNYSTADTTEWTGSTGLEVRGTLAGTSITATRVEDDDDGFAGDVDKASIEGIVTDFVSIGNFRVAGVPVNATTGTLIPASLVLADGMEVEVEGPVAGGVLQAVRVEARGGDVELEAQVSAASVMDGTITLQYHGGLVTVQVDSRSSLRDEAGEDEYLLLAEIGATDFLEIHAGLDNDGNIVASEVKRVWMAGDPPEEVGDDILQGPADDCDGSSVSVFGVGFTLDGGTSLQDENEDPVADAASFCTAVDAQAYCR